MGTPEFSLLTGVQKQIVGTAITLSAGVVILAVIGLIIYSLSQFVAVFSRVLWPLVIASILALLLRPVVHFLEQKSRIGRTAALILLFVMVLLVGVGILSLVLPILITQTMDLLQNLPDIAARAREFLSTRFPALFTALQHQLSKEVLTQVTIQWEEHIKRGVTVAMSVLFKAGSGLSSLFGWFAGLAIIPVYLFYLLGLDRDLVQDLGEQLVFVKPAVRDDILFLMREFANIVTTFFQGQLLIGLVTGVMLATGFTVIGLSFGVILGLVIGLLNLIPYLGTILGLGTVLPLAYFQQGGSLLTVGLALLVFIIAQAIESYGVSPRIMGKSTGLHPMVILIALFFWYTALDGILGMILGIPLTAFLITAWRLIKKKYLTTLPEE
jgi:predicted PurR-regulated permease PerM